MAEISAMNIYPQKKKKYLKPWCYVILLVFIIIAFSLSPIINGGPAIAHAQTAESGDWLVEFFKNPFSIIYNIGKALSSISADLLDLSIQFSINTEHYNNPGVQNAWEVFRDIANMVFIFILVYIAFATILQLSNFNTKRTLAALILVALLLNFSFFLTGLVIDAANVAGIFLYDIMTNDRTWDLSAQLQSRLQMQNLADATGEAVGSTRSLFYVFGGVFFFVAAFTFLAAAILFALRTIGLVFVLVLAPIAFAAAILPNTQKHWGTWVGRLLHLSFLLPFFLLLVAVVLLIIDGWDAAQTGEVGRVGSDVANPSTGYVLPRENVALVLNFILIIGLLIAALKFSQDMAGSLGKLSVKWTGRAIGLTAATVGFGYRQTGGRIFRGIRESERVQKMEASESRIIRNLGRFTRATADYGAKARGDVRAGPLKTAVGATAAAAALKGGGVDVNVGRPPREGGFDRTRNAAVRRRVQLAGAQQATRKRQIEQDVRAEREAEHRRIEKESRDRQTQFGQAMNWTQQQINNAIYTEVAGEVAKLPPINREIDQQMQRYREQQAQDLAGEADTALGRVLSRVLTTIGGTTAANKEAADVVRGRRAPPPQEQGLSAQQRQEMEDIVRQNVST